MRFLGAYESLTELSERVELLEQESGKSSEQLVVFAKEEHKEDLRNLVDVQIEIVDEEKSLEKFGLDKETAEMYNETIQLGGYVLLEKEN